MKKISLTFLTLLPLLSVGQSFNQIDLLVLGTFHFGETPDFQGGSFDDVLSRKRQREIRRVVQELASYKPDKIFVENTGSAQRLWDNVYQNYKKGLLPTDEAIVKNEIFQLGIRTAALTDANGVICVNYTHPDTKKQLLFRNPVQQKWADFTRVVNAKKPDYASFFKSNALAQTTFNTYMENHKKWQTLPLRLHLLKMNEPESLKNLHYFNVLAWMDNNTNGVGAELSSEEYFRNLKIVQNIYSKLERSDERILIIIGAAHAKVITDMLESHPVFNMVEVRDVLR